MIVSKFLPDLQKRIEFNYKSDLFTTDPLAKLRIEKDNKLEAKNVYTANLALITLKYYIKFL